MCVRVCTCVCMCVHAHVCICVWCISGRFVCDCVSICISMCGDGVSMFVCLCVVWIVFIRERKRLVVKCGENPMLALLPVGHHRLWGCKFLFISV